MKKRVKYPLELRPLADEEGGVWLVTYPNLPVLRMPDGVTP